MTMASHAYITLILSACFYLGLTFAQNKTFEVAVNQNGTFSLWVKGTKWLDSGPTFFNNNGKRYCTKEGTLKLVKVSESESVDLWAIWKTTHFTYRAGEATVETSVKVAVRTVPPLPLPDFVLFTQKYLSPVNKTRGEDKDDVISSFPSFKLPSEDSSPSLGYLGYGNDMAGWVSLNLGRFNNKKANFSTGIRGGPLVLFDKGKDVLIISPFNNFMASSNRMFGKEHLSYGIMGLVDQVPATYNMTFMVYYEGSGIKHSIARWGEVLTKQYSKGGWQDITREHLGYWTDNGAYYYYHKEKGKTYEETLVDEVNSLKAQGVPIRYLQIDSWFYTKGHVGGTQTWTPQISMFPDGFTGLNEKTQLPIVCHNRYWDNDTIFAKYNGGQYNFISDEKTGYAIPDDKQFWSDLLRNATRAKAPSHWSHIVVYEQDWLDHITDNNHVLLSDLELGRRWLKHLDNAVDDRFQMFTIFSMAYPRHILQALELNRVTQARVSDDYQPGNQQWKIGITSIFTNALNLGSSKDVFWTSRKQPGNPYGLSEPNPYIQLVMAVFSNGPVGIGDGLGYTDKELIKKCCDNLGNILYSKQPLTAIDVSLKRAAFDGINPHGKGEVLYATVETMLTTLVAYDIVGTYTLRPYDIDTEYPLYNYPNFVFNAQPDAKGDYHFRQFGKDQPLVISRDNCGRTFCVFHIVPSNGDENQRISLLGELDKINPMSIQRFWNINRGGQWYRMSMRAYINPGEVVHIWFLIYLSGENSMLKVTCDNSQGTSAYLAYVWADTSGAHQCNMGNKI